MSKKLASYCQHQRPNRNLRARGAQGPHCQIPGETAGAAVEEADQLRLSEEVGADERPWVKGRFAKRLPNE